MRDLRSELAVAPVAFLEGALGNPHFSAQEAALLLRNRRATADMVRRVAANPRWCGQRAVAKALMRHPQVTPAIATRLIPGMNWKDLAETCASPHTPASVCQSAESALRQRFPEMALGERIAFARIASCGVIPIVLASDDASVLTALLGNPFLQESDVTILARDKAAADLLTVLSTHHRWKDSLAMQTALASNAQTPIRIALGLLSGLEGDSLQRLSKDDRVPTIVRVAAERASAQRSNNETTTRQRPRVHPRGHR